MFYFIKRIVLKRKIEVYVCPQSIEQFRYPRNSHLNNEGSITPFLQMHFTAVHMR